MRTIVSTLLAAVIVAALTAQMAAAAPHHGRKSAHLSQQTREAYGSTQPVEGKSCDMIWCYAN